MTCADARERLTECAGNLGELSDLTGIEIRAHLRSCSTCSKLIESLRLVSTEIARLPNPRVPGGSVEWAVRRAIAKERTGQPRRGAPRLAWLVPVATTATIILAYFGSRSSRPILPTPERGIAVTSHAENQNSPHPSKRSAVQADAIEQTVTTARTVPSAERQAPQSSNRQKASVETVGTAVPQYAEAPARSDSVPPTEGRPGEPSAAPPSSASPAAKEAVAADVRPLRELSMIATATPRAGVTVQQNVVTTSEPAIFRLSGVHGPATARVYTRTGAVVRQLWSGEAPEAGIELRWDGRDESGLPVASGLYEIVVQSPGRMDREQAIVRR